MGLLELEDHSWEQWFSSVAAQEDQIGRFEKSQCPGVTQISATNFLKAGHRHWCVL